jgi:crossover junction endodeoxyribonuclease RuvC
MNVMGVDLSLTGTGIALPDGDTMLLNPGKRRGMERLAWIRNAILGPWHEYEPAIVAIEGYSYGSHSAAYDLGELGGVVRLTLWEAGIVYVDVPPAVAKGYATGKGNANKNEMLVAAAKRLGYEGTSNDEADALWCRAAVLAVRGEPVVAMPQAHNRHLEKLAVLMLAASTLTPT